jgi:Cu-Zn family superoxide dismutase
MRRSPFLALAFAALATPAAAQEAEPAPEPAPEAAADIASQGGTGALVDAEGRQLGNVSVEAAPSGHALVLANAQGFPEGVLAVHLHEAGACDGPAFDSAGGHIDGGREHGVRSGGGPHPGDLPNAHVGPDGALAFDAVAVGLAMDMVFDADGSALIVHAGPDDYASQPSGDAGGRIACAVIEPAAAGPAADEASGG